MSGSMNKLHMCTRGSVHSCAKGVCIKPEDTAKRPEMLIQVYSVSLLPIEPTSLGSKATCVPSRPFLWDVNLHQEWKFSSCLFCSIQLVSLGLFFFRSLCVASSPSLGHSGKAAIQKQHRLEQILTHLPTLLAQAGWKCLSNSISSVMWIQTHLLSAY